MKCNAVMSYAAMYHDLPSPERTSTAATLREQNTLANLSFMDSPFTTSLSMHEFRQRQRTPVARSHADVGTKPLRRKPSLEDLARPTIPLSSSSSSSETLYRARGRASVHAGDCLPSTPCPKQTKLLPAAHSAMPLLSPSTSPHQPPTPYSELPREQPRRWFSDLISTKRKFSQVKQAKRLPRRRGSGGGGGSERGCFPEQQTKVRYRANESRLLQPLHPGQRSADDRITDSHSISTSVSLSRQQGRSRNPEEHIDRSSTSEDYDEVAATSTFTLSKFAFPAPPNHISGQAVAGSATVLCEGAYFDLLNPHASLLEATHHTDSSAEVDALLDEYYDNTSDLTQSRSILIPRPQSHPQPTIRIMADNARHTRRLYDNPDSARRNIMRSREDLSSSQGNAIAHSSAPQATGASSPETFNPLSGGLSGTPEHLDQVQSNNRLPLAGSSSSAVGQDRSPSATGQQQGGEYNHPALLFPGPRPQAGSVSGMASARSSHLKRLSIRSDPFDLTLTDTEDEGNTPQASIVDIAEGIDEYGFGRSGSADAHAYVPLSGRPLSASALTRYLSRQGILRAARSGQLRQTRAYGGSVTASRSLW